MRCVARRAKVQRVATVTPLESLPTQSGLLRARLFALRAERKASRAE